MKISITWLNNGKKDTQEYEIELTSTPTVHKLREALKQLSPLPDIIEIGAIKIGYKQYLPKYNDNTPITLDNSTTVTVTLVSKKTRPSYPNTRWWRYELKEKMKEADIRGISIASFNSEGPAATMTLGVDTSSTTPVTSETIFRAASLSKPVFAYLVLKLIADNKSDKAKLELGKFNLPSDLKEFNLDTPLYKILPEILKRFSGDDIEKAKKLTARYVLSHQTGLPIKPSNEPLKFQFEPGKEYGYSNPAIAFLQEVIEKLTNKNLETLAQENVFKPLRMRHSNFLPTDTNKLSEVHAENSLHTTTSDYARFVAGWLRDENLQYAFKSEISMTEDKWAVGQGLSKEELQKVAWGLGWGLQLTSDGKVIRAFHSGDMNEWRAFVAINLENKTGIVYFANSRNGLILAEKIISPTVDLEDGFKYIFEKYGFARKIEPDWQKKEVERVSKIIATYEQGGEKQDAEKLDTQTSTSPRPSALSTKLTLAPHK